MDDTIVETFQLSEEAISKAYELLPAYMVPALLRYWNDKLPPGDFLTAVLENKLMEAIMYADDVNKTRLHDYAHWLYNYAPGRPNGWGSPEAVAEWLNS